MAVFIGTNTLFALSQAEGSFGTEAARVRTARVLSVGLGSKTTSPVIEDLSAYNNAPTERIVSDQEVMGDVVANLAYQGNALGLWLHSVFGTVAEGGGGGPTYTHTYTPAALASYSGETRRGSSGASEEFYGLVAQKAVIEIPDRGPAKITITYVGKNAGARAAESPSIPSIATSAYYVRGHECTGLVFSGTTYPTKRIVITIDNKVEGLKEHGSIYIGDAIRTGRMEIKVEAELNQRGAALKTAALAGTSAAWSVTCSDGTRSLAFSGAAGFFEAHDDAISSTGPIQEKVTLRALAVQGSDSGITVVLTNGDNTYEDS